MLRELPLLLALLICFLVWLERQQRAEVHASAAEIAQLSANAAASALEASMTTQAPEHVWLGVENRLCAGGDTDVRVVNNQGEVLYTTRREHEGAVFTLADPACAMCHVKGSEEAVPWSTLFEEMSTADTRLHAVPLRNADECRTCHDGDGAKLGVVYAEHSLLSEQRLLKRTRNGLIAGASMAYLLSLLITGFVTRRYIDRPLKHLLKGAREFGAGNLYSTVELPEKSELSVLADTFNSSTTQLRESIQKIENHRDDLRTLYFIADQLGQRVDPEERRRRAVELVGTIFESDCLLIAGHFHPESRVFLGTLTYRDANSQIVEVPFEDPDDAPEGISFYAPGAVEWWMRGDLDGQLMVRDGTSVAYPLERRGRRLGLIVAPALLPSAFADGRPTAANPAVVKAFSKHLALALDLSELRREHVQQGRLAAVGGIVAGISHCLKNTLNGLRGGIYVVERAMENDNAERLDQGWKVLTSSVQQIEALSLDMLYFSRAQQPKIGLTDPNRILQEVVNLLTESSASKGVTVRAELHESVGKMRLDRLATYRVVLNLVTNAVDACAESETDGAGDMVIVRSCATGDELQIQIEDNGVGMSESTMKRMFEQFFSTKLGRGTGLGLPVVKKILDEQGGSLGVDSALGEGTTFTIRLPLPADEG